MAIVLIDNYDSFTYNLYQYIVSLDRKVIVLKNSVTIDEIESYKPEAIILSPGPGNPDDAGICKEVVKYYCDKVPILGICLGHQVIGEVFGAKIIKGIRPVHGKVSEIIHDGKTIFSNIPNLFNVVRYHSLVIDKNTVPSCLKINATSEDGEIMGVQHNKYPVVGVQFHPESILSEYGLIILDNFFKMLNPFINQSI